MRPSELVVEGGITEIFGRPSTGRTSLLVACLREVTRRGAIAALVDTDHVFDPRGAARAGVELSRALWASRRSRAACGRSVGALSWLHTGGPRYGCLHPSAAVDRGVPTQARRP